MWVALFLETVKFWIAPMIKLLIYISEILFLDLLG